MSEWYLFLDDERYPPRDSSPWKIARSLKEVKILLDKYGNPSFISFDHDLGTTETGLDVAKWLCERDMNTGTGFTSDFNFYVHSQNPVGAKNIREYIFSYMKHLEETRSNR